jgi:AcrR family transcriptional regulator
MPGEPSPTGDPARVLELLWGSPERRGRRGPRPGLSVETIVRSAIAIADGDGLEAVTMRRLADSLGVRPMALYTYVPGKSELLDLMLDTVYGELPRAAWRDDGWRERLATVAHDNRALFEAHPWAAAISTSRPPLGPGLMAKYEHELGALANAGLDDIETDAALTFLLDFVRSAALAAQDARATRQDTGMTDEEWWAANAPLLARIIDEEAYPTAARIGAAAGAAHGGAYSPDHAWEFGLARVLDGLGALIERHGHAGGGTSRENPLASGRGDGDH